MSFEDDVLASVNKMLTPGDQASFTHGTLFVRSTEQIANSILESLSKEFPGTSISLTKFATSTEYSFSFLQS